MSVTFSLHLVQTLYQQARKSITHGEFSVVISCLRLIRHIHTLLPEYQAELLTLDSRPYDRFPRLLQNFERLVSLILQLFDSAYMYMMLNLVYTIDYANFN